MRSFAPAFSLLLLGLAAAPGIYGVTVAESEQTGAIPVARASAGESEQVQPRTRRHPMQTQPISAEVIPASGQANAAAIALQRRGFRILHIGQTVSVEGSDELWGKTFGVSFEVRKKQVMPEIEGGDVTYRKAITDNMRIPPDLSQSITDVAFQEPPELF